MQPLQLQGDHIRLALVSQPDAHVDGDDRPPRSEVVAKRQPDFVRLEGDPRGADSLRQDAFGNPRPDEILVEITVDAFLREGGAPFGIMLNLIVKAEKFAVKFTGKL